MIKVSVIIPAYNSEATIKDAICSVLSEGNIEYVGEIIIINDGSTDATEKKVNEIIVENPNVKIILKNKSNGGVSSARNIGMRMASYDWIALLDSDDVWLENKLQKQISLLADDNINFVGSNRNNEYYFPWLKNKKIIILNTTKLLFKCYPQTSTALIKKRIIEILGGYDESMRYGEDANLWLKISTITDLYLINETLVITGGGKKSYGVSGLSANLKEMHAGEIKNLIYLRNQSIVSKFSFLFLFAFIKVKYCKRLFVINYVY
jgi:glycosyltransferase involved in cell wall biosynthesis